MRALDGILDEHCRPQPEGSLRLVGFSAIVTEGTAALVPTALLTRSTAIERECLRRGLELVDEPALVVWPHRQQISSGHAQEYEIRSIRFASTQLEPDASAIKIADRLLSAVSTRQARPDREILAAVADLAALVRAPVDGSAHGAALVGELIGTVIERRRQL